MEENLKLYEIRIGLTDLKPIDNNILKDVLKNYNSKEAIFKILFCGIYPFNLNYTFDDGIKYYKNLITTIGNILNVEYTEEEQLILALYTMPRFNIEVQKKEKAEEIISIYESVCNYSNNEEILEDGIWWARQCARHKLLDFYAAWVYDDSMYEKMKNLLINLKNEKEKYIEIGDNLTIKYHGDI